MLPVSKNGIMLPHKWRTKSVLEIIGMAFSAFICCFETPLNWRSHYDHVLFSCLISFTFLWLQLHKTLHLHYHTEMHLNLSTRFPQYQCERSRCQGCCSNQVALTWNNTSTLHITFFLRERLTHAVVAIDFCPTLRFRPSFSLGIVLSSVPLEHI